MQQNDSCKIEELNLYNNQIGVAGAKSLAAMIAVCQSLNSIDVGLNGIDQAAALELLAAMKEKAMVSIGMASCKLGVEGAKVVAEMAAVSRSLTECDLRRNNLGKEGWCAIFDALRDSPQNKIAKWDLTGQGITAEIFKSLTAYMAVSHSLTVADLRYTHLDTKSATTLANIAKEKKISLCGIAPDQTEADFTPSRNKNNRMKPEDAILLTADLTVRSSLSSVNLLKNHFDVETVTMLAKISKEKKLTLCGIAPDQAEADFSSMGLRPADTILIAASLEFMGSLTQVTANLCRCSFPCAYFSCLLLAD